MPWRIEEWTPDVVVLDLALPRLGGRDLKLELKSRRGTRHVPIIVVSGTDTSDLNPEDFASILHKPIDPEALVNAVDQAVRNADHRARIQPV
jgi:CheY-like chemotaxis protein